MITPEFQQRIQAVVGAAGLVTETDAIAPYLVEQRGLYHGVTKMVVRPASTEETAAVVRICAEAGVPIVPQCGNTGLVGGAAPDESGEQIIVNLSRMNRIRAIDPINFTMTVDAGVILSTVQQAAADAGCLFPLSFAAEGSCEIGGCLAANAGGSGVLRYGNARELAFGLEVVLPDGRVWNGLRGLRKDNTGYDLKDLFIGSEGTLGIITGAVLKLFPKPQSVQTAFCALSSLEASIRLLTRARAATGDLVSSFELIPRIALEMVLTHIEGSIDPLAERHDWCVLMEVTSSRADAQLDEMVETLLGDAMEDGEVVDAVLANSLEQRKQLWRLREDIPGAERRAGASIKHDVAVPVSLVPEFIEEATQAVVAAMPGIRPVPFGHVGDGNIHFNLTQPEGADSDAFLARWYDMNRIVHDIVTAKSGTISAEHGIGKLKKDEMAHYKEPVEVELMKRIKTVIDPQGLMNPGKIV